MSEYLPILGTLLGAAVGGAIGFGSAYFIERQRFKKEDEDKLYEKVYGTVYPILIEAKRRYEPSGQKTKFQGDFLLTPHELVQIEGIMATNSKLIPLPIRVAWSSALEKGPPSVGSVPDERLIYDLENVLTQIKIALVKRANRK